MTVGGSLALTAVPSAAAVPEVASLASSPGTPGTPQPPTTVYAENFQNRPGPAPIVRLNGYTGVSGQTYTADPTWLVGCNGWIASANESTTSAAQIADCGASQANWNRAQQLAQGLGMASGLSTAAALDNYAVSAYTSNSPGAGRIEFQTATNIPFATANRFIAFSVDVAAINCNVSAPLLQFSLLTDSGTAIPAGTQVNACTSPKSVTIPALGAVGAIGGRVGTYTANGSVLITGSSIGVRMVNNNGSGGGNDHAFDNITILDVTPQLDKSFSPAVVGVGQSSTMTLTVTNTSELASKNGWSFTDNLPSGLSIVGPASTTCPSSTVTAPIGTAAVSVTGSLSAGMVSCAVTVDVSSSAVGVLTNTAANVSPRSGVSPPGPATVTFTEEPSLSIVKSSTTSMLPAVGATIPYSFLVTNTGNVTMAELSVTDSGTVGVICSATTLAPAASTTCTGAHTVTQSDVDAGAVTNTATVTGKPPISPPIAPVPSNQVTILASQLPALSVVKSSTTVRIPPVGSTIPYAFEVTNTGNVSMSAVTVSDPNASGVSCPVTTLAPGASMMCTGSHTVVQAEVDAAVVTNAASVVGTAPNGTAIPPVASNQVTITGVQNPVLSVVKSSTSTQLPVAGEAMPYSFLVTNIGDVTMSGIVVVDPNTSGVSCPVTTLAPGASTTCAGSHLVTQADLNAGQVVNTATVTGAPPAGAPIPHVSSNQLTIPGVQNPGLAVVKSTTTTGVHAVGDVVPYDFTVMNVGNVTMDAITVTDPNVTDIFCPLFTLPPGVATTCTGTHTVTQADLDAGAVRNSATVVGTPPGGAPPIAPVVSNEITVPASQIQSLSLLKTSTSPIVPAPGQTIPYELTVTNTGNVTIAQLAVSDAKVGPVSCPETTLAPGASTTCAATYTVTASDFDSGQVVNTATVAGTAPDGSPIPPVVSNEVVIVAIQGPALTMVKASTTTTVAAAGQTVPFTFTVANTGNVSMDAIAVSDPTIAAVGCPQTTLTAGASMTCTATYSVTQADIDAGQVVNVATVVGTPPGGTPITPAVSNQVTIPIQAPIPPPSVPAPPGTLPSVGRNTARMLRPPAALAFLGLVLIIAARRRHRL